MKDIARYAVFAALFAIPFLPLLVVNSFFFPFITGKGFAFRILVEIALAGYAVLALMDRRYRPQFSWVLVLYGALAVWMFVANLFALNAYKAFWSNYERMDGWITLIHLFAFFVVAGSFLTVERKWRAWWGTFIAASALICLYGVFQLMGAFEIHQGGVRLDATVGNAAYLAAYLLFAIAITAWRALESSGGWRYALTALVALEALMLFYTATRGAILAFVGALVVVGALFAYEARGRARTVALSGLALLFVLVGGFFLLRGTAFVEENATLARLSSISLESAAPRLAIWQMAGQGIMERPVLGWGQEGFNYVFTKHYEPSMFAQEPWFDRAHNVFLDWAVAGGIPALLIFVALLIAAVIALYARGAEATRAERILLTGVIAAYAFQALFVFDNILSYMPLAAVLAMAHAARTRPIKALANAGEMREQTATTVAAPVAAVLLIAVVWFVNAPAMLAANGLIRALSSSTNVSQGLALLKETSAMGSFASQEIAEQAVMYAGQASAVPSIPADQRLALARYAIDLVDEQVAAYPNDPRLRLQAAAAHRAAGDIPGAITEVEAARALSPKKQQILIQQGMLLWESGRVNDAAALFDQAYALDTSFPELAAYSAAGAFITNDPVRGKKVLMDAYGTTTVDHTVLSYAYFSAKRYDDLVGLWQLRAKTGGPDAGYQLALAYAAAGKQAEALRTVDAVLKQYPLTTGAAAQVRAQIQAP